MKKRFHIILTTVIIFILSYQPIMSQTTEQVKERKYYETWVTPIGYPAKIKGYLLELEDSLIVLSTPSNYEGQSIDFKNIKEIKFRKKGRVGRCILSGALTGLVFGGITGLVSGDNNKNSSIAFTAEDKAMIYGLSLAIPGALIGGIIGSIKIKVPINGNAKNQKEKLLKYKPFY